MCDEWNFSNEYVNGLKGMCYELPKSKPENLDQVLRYLSAVTHDLRAWREKVASAPDSRYRMVPSDDVVLVLRHLGWALYEAALVATDRVDAAYMYREGESRKKSEAAAVEIAELANLARRLPWPHFALRGIGAIRGEALACSKQDTQDGYKQAWTVHTEADKLLLRLSDEIFSGYLSETVHFLDLKRDIAEVSEQLELSKTGTACRRAEFMLTHWELLLEQKQVRTGDQPDVIALLVHDLRLGISTGETAMRLAQSVHDEHRGIPKDKDHKHLLGPTSKQNPGIMTARAHLLLMPMCPLMQRYERAHPDGERWDVYAEQLAASFRTVYAEIEQPYPSHRDGSMSFISRHLRSIVQLRLGFGLIRPGERVPTAIDHAGFPTAAVIDEQNILELSRWLEKREYDANVIGSVTMPEYVSGITALRSGEAHDDGYAKWRLGWKSLDRYHDLPGREEAVKTALGLNDGSAA